MSRSVRLCVLFLIAAQGVAGAGCGDQGPVTLPTGPSVPGRSSPTPAGPAPAASVVTRGTVSDSAFRPLQGATIEVLGGRLTGVSTVSDARGEFFLPGELEGTTLLRAFKEGHVPITRPFSYVGTSRFVFFYLVPLSPQLDISGDYTLTFIADSCSAIPAELRRRSYAVTIAPAPTLNNPAPFFKVTIHGGRFLANYDAFSIGVAGDAVGFPDNDGPTLVEEISPDTYLTYESFGWAPTERNETEGVATISTAFLGLDYCVLNAGTTPAYRCRTDQAISHARCDSSDQRLTLTRR
jgi:hypothetical protein